MAVNAGAKAYADNFSPIFVSRYIAAVKAGRADVVPQGIRPSVEAYVYGRTTATVDVNRWVWDALYNHRASKGTDAQLPPDFSGGSSGSNGAAVGMAVAGGLFKFIAALIKLAPKRL
jgi:hypothetical protein